MSDQDSTNQILRNNLLKKYKPKSQNKRVVGEEGSSSGQLKPSKNQLTKKSISQSLRIKAMGSLKRRTQPLVIAFLTASKKSNSLEEEDSA